MTLSMIYWSYVVADSWFSFCFSLEWKLHNQSLNTLLIVISTLMACLVIKWHMHTSRYVNTHTILISKKEIVILVPTICMWPKIQSLHPPNWTFDLHFMMHHWFWFILITEISNLPNMTVHCHQDVFISCVYLMVVNIWASEKKWLPSNPMCLCNHFSTFGADT